MKIHNIIALLVTATVLSGGIFLAINYNHNSVTLAESTSEPEPAVTEPRVPALGRYYDGYTGQMPQATLTTFYFDDGTTATTWPRLRILTPLDCNDRCPIQD
jgi:hypothetical protein